MEESEGPNNIVIYQEVNIKNITLPKHKAKNVRGNDFALKVKRRMRRKASSQKVRLQIPYIFHLQVPVLIS